MRKMTFAQRFKFLRLGTGMNQTEFAKHFIEKTGTNMTISAVSNYENGHRVPEVSMLQTISDYFDVTVDFLLGRSEDRKATVPTDDGLSDENVKFREYSMIYDNLRARLIQEGILGENDDFTPDLLKLFLLLGEDTAIKVLKAKGIDPAALIK